MLVRWIIFALLLVGVALGCKPPDRRPDTGPPFDGGRVDGGRMADVSSRPKDWLKDTRDPERTPGSGHWTEGPSSTRPPRGNAPPADSYVDPKDPAFDVRTESRGVLAGHIYDPEGRKAGKLFVQVEPMPSEGTGAPMEIEALNDGSFMIKGLKPGVSYRLTCRATDGQRILAGRTYAKPPKMDVRISLIEGLDLEEAKPAPRTPGTPGSKPPILYIDEPTKPLPPPDFTPSVGRSSLPAPKPLDREREFSPTSGDLPNTDGWSPTSPPPSRPDLTTVGPRNPWTPPTATIPGPGGLLDPPPLVPLPSPSPERSRSQVVRPGNQFTLVDNQSRSRTLPSGREGELILLEFMTTNCLPCQKSVPDLKDLQRKFGARGLEVVAVACDDENFQTRLSLAERYRKDFELNYSVLTEPTKKPGELLKKFGVDRYPTVVLLDASGAVLWQGHPTKKDELEKAILGQLRK